MALGKYSRIDGRKSPVSYCSTATFVVFIGLCLVGVWMMTSSSIVPVQNIEETTQDLKTEIPAQLKETNDESNRSSDNGNSNSESNESNENDKSDSSNSNSESNASSDNSNSEGNTDSDRNSSNESNTSDSKSDTESNTSSSNDESNTSRDNKADSESNMTGKSSSDDESNMSSDSKSNTESNTSSKSSSSDESNTSSDSKSDSESNTSSKSSSNDESNTSSDSKSDSESNTSSKSSSNDESSTSSESKSNTESKTSSSNDDSNTSSDSKSDSESNTSSKSSSNDGSNTNSDSKSDSESNRSSSNDESNTSSDSKSNTESNTSSSNDDSNTSSDSKSNTESDKSSSNDERNTSSDSKTNTESNTSSSNDDSNTSSDSKSNTESDKSSSNDESNTSSDSKTNTESNKSSSNDESKTSSDSKSDTESNTDSESTQSNKYNESNTNSESNTNNESKSDSESTENNTDSKSAKSNTNLESTSGSSTDNDSQPKQFDDNPGKLPEDATKGDNVTLSSSERISSQPGTTSEQRTEDNQENKPVKQSRKEDTNTENGSKSETGNEDYKREDMVSETEDKKSKDGGKKPGIDEINWVFVNSSSGGQGESKEDSKETTSKSDEGENESEMSSEPRSKDEKKKSTEIRQKKELLLSGAQSELLNQTVSGDGAWKTQVAESKREAHKSLEPSQKTGSGWKLCNVTAGPDYIPCLDNIQAIRNLKSNKHYEHRERHCPDDLPTCLVSLPEGYQRPVEWPTSREKIWYHNVPHKKLAEIKGHQNWVKFSGEYLTFPGGGTQFKHGALHYIDFIQEIAPDIAWGKSSRVVLDVGCGVASFGGFLFERDVLTMSFAPKDEHEAQVQFALERGIPAFLAVMGTKRLPFPGKVFDMVHCARCRVPWHIEGGKLLLELNRLLRPGGYFVWSATPIYRIRPQDIQIWEAMKQLAKDICWDLITIGKDTLNEVGVAVFQKPSSNKCYESRSVQKPPLCKDSDDPNASWNVPLQVCMHKIPDNATERGSKWPEQWPGRVEKPPYWLLSSQVGVYGKPAPEDFLVDYEHWKRVVSKSYITGLGINWSSVRNVMDMRAVYGGFAAALKDLNIWVMNVVSVDAPDTLPIIFERGLFGMYHDWCESFSTYPRTYDLIHADHLFSKIKKKCNFEASVVEVDRILRPEGKLIVRDKVQTISELETVFKSMQWEVRMSYAKDKEGLLCVQKSIWRPEEAITIPYAIA